ncbi:MAG TPA: YbhB/YbcL family Raf kinase inhibitor-like protein, partial [Steroidobacteraceae bacterium]
MAGTRTRRKAGQAPVAGMAVTTAAAVGMAVALGLGGPAAAGAADGPATKAAAPTAKKSKASKLALVSPDIGQGKTLSEDQVFNLFGCKGKNLSPELHWSGAPEGTKSFAVMVFDPDAPTGSGFWHWVVYDIPADVDHLPAEAGDPKKPGLPKGAIQGRTDFGISAYGGPCPPPGKPHHYHFKLFALKVPKLEVPADATAAMIG